MLHYDTPPLIPLVRFVSYRLYMFLKTHHAMLTVMKAMTVVLLSILRVIAFPLFAAFAVM